jgi:hypothetical protein
VLTSRRIRAFHATAVSLSATTVVTVVTAKR